MRREGGGGEGRKGGGKGGREGGRKEIEGACWSAGH